MDMNFVNSLRYAVPKVPKVSIGGMCSSFDTFVTGIAGVNNL